MAVPSPNKHDAFKAKAKAVLLPARDEAEAVGSLRFYGQMLRDVPEAAWSALGWFGNLVLLVLGILFVLNRSLARLVSSWHGISPWWAVVPFGLLFLVGILRANYRRHTRLQGKLNDALREASEAAGELARLDALGRDRDRPIPADHQTVMEQLLQGVRSALQNAQETHFGELEEEAFVAHFADLVPIRDNWNAAVARANDAPRKLRDWISIECTRLGVVAPPYDVTKVLDAVQAVLRNTPSEEVVFRVFQTTDFDRPELIRVCLGSDINTPIVIVPRDPEATLEARIRDVAKPVNAVLLNSQKADAYLEIAASRQARDALVHPSNREFALHAGVPIYPSMGCPWCRKHAENRGDVADV